MDANPPTFQTGDFKSLPLYVVQGVALQDIPQFGKGQISIRYADPDYPTLRYSLSSDWLGRVSKDHAIAAQMVTDWTGHFQRYVYFVQFKDDIERSRIAALHAHTELVSALCDARLGIDTAPLWAQFDQIHPFELIHSEYRADADRASRYDEYAQRLAAVYERSSERTFEAIHLVQRIVRQIELKKNQWATMPPLESSALTSGSGLSNAVSLFYSYSHKDEGLRDQLETHLAALKRQGAIAQWHDRKIAGGNEWKGHIDQNLETANIILLLVSADFIASDYCYDVEMMRSLARQRAGQARVIPIILRACDWHEMPFHNLQSLPKDGKAVKSWSDIDEAFTDVAKGIRKAVEESRNTS